MSQIRITKTSEIENILNFLKTRWPLMDEVELVKMSISKFYQEQKKESQTFRKPDKEELTAINEFLKNPDLIGEDESVKFLEELKQEVN